MNTADPVRGAAIAGCDTALMRRSALLLLALALVAASCSDSTEDGDDAASDIEATADDAMEEGSEQTGSADQSAAVSTNLEPEQDPPIWEEVVGRTNVQASGNRTLPGALDLSAAPTTIELPFPAVWVVPLDDGRTAVVGADGSSVVIDGDAISELASVDPIVRPLAIEDGGELRLVPASEGVDSDLPDATEVEAGGIRAWYDGATERVPHGALGDTVETTRLVILRRLISDPMDDAGEPLQRQERIVVDLQDAPGEPVFEGLSPMLADVDRDGEIDIITTISDRDVGATLVVFDSDGNRMAESSSIGQGNRWRHQLAAAPTGPNGAIEIVEVQTPHLSGDLQFQSVETDQLVLRRTQSGFRSHVLGSRNMDGAVVFDADGDGSVEVVVPTGELTTIVAVEPAADGGDGLTIDLGGAEVSSNLALAPNGTGLRFAVGLSDGRLLLWQS